jgi:hypothetical protein
MKTTLLRGAPRKKGGPPTDDPGNTVANSATSFILDRFQEVPDRQPSPSNKVFNMNRA